MRLRLRESGPAGYFNSFPLNAAMDEILTVGEVVESRAEGFAPGDVVTHAWGWRDYALVHGRRSRRSAASARWRTVDTSLAPPEKFLGPVGNMALTAYVGLIDAAELREGDVVWVSAAAGAVGSLAVQIAKLRGHTVIGSAGSPDKVRYLLDELGLDAAFDYHDGPVARPAARGRAGRHRRLLRQRRRRPPAGRAGRHAPLGPDRDVRRDLRVRALRAAARPDATSSRSSPTT